MTHRPWSELTKHWSPERRAATARPGTKIDAHIRRLQTGAVNDDPAPGDIPVPSVVVAHAVSEPPSRVRSRTRA